MPQEATVAQRNTIQFSRPPKFVALAGPDKPAAFEKEAVREAYQRGFEEASAQFEKQIVTQRNEITHLSQETLRSLENQHQSLVEQLRTAIPDLVTEVARRVFAGLEIDRDMVARLVNEALHEVAPGADALEVALSPHDLALIEDLEKNLREKYPAIVFRADSTLQPGDCVARTRFGVIDARIQTKMKTVGRFLR